MRLLFLHRLDRFNTVLYMCATAALLAAVVTVIYLQHMALAAQERQTRIILNKMSEQTATAIAAELRRVFDGPVINVLTAASPTDLQRERLDLIADMYAHGIREYPQVDRFFVWTAGTQAVAPNEVLFYGRPEADSSAGVLRERLGQAWPARALDEFQRDPAWGRRIFDFVHETDHQKRVYATGEREVDKTRYDFFARRYWVDAKRTRLYALMGFVTNLDTVHTALFPELTRRYLARMLDPGPGWPGLEMHIVDEGGRRVFATGDQVSSVAARSTVELRFYPMATVRTRLSGEAPKRDWTVLVGPSAHNAEAMLRSPDLRGYGLAALSVLLMFTGLFFARQGFRRERELARKQADFVAQVSHQLKTPLSVLNGVCETLALDRARSPEHQAQYLEMMKSGVVRLTALVERILEFSRVNERRRTYEREPVEVGPLVRETVEAFRRDLNDDTALITVEGDGSMLVVMADPAALEQALINLLDNAVKYSDQHKNVAVWVSRSGSDAVIEVSDHGVGLTGAERTHVFEKFYRGAGASLNREGFGLGLAIVRELVLAQHGRIEVDSRLGLGSTFRIIIPVLKRKRSRARHAAHVWWPRRGPQATASDYVERP
jgi:signal transduction histidine kinase